jgi:hypothetical protein
MVRSALIRFNDHLRGPLVLAWALGLVASTACHGPAGPDRPSANTTSEPATTDEHGLPTLVSLLRRVDTSRGSGNGGDTGSNRGIMTLKTAAGNIVGDYNLDVTDAGGVPLVEIHSVTLVGITGTGRFDEVLSPCHSAAAGAPCSDLQLRFTSGSQIVMSLTYTVPSAGSDPRSYLVEGSLNYTKQLILDPQCTETIDAVPLPIPLPNFTPTRAIFHAERAFAGIGRTTVTFSHCLCMLPGGGVSYACATSVP